MKKRTLYPLLLLLLCGSTTWSARAQNAVQDSGQVAKTLKELCLVCRSVDFKDPQSQQLGVFYKAAKYVVYRGDDKARSWKDFANYKVEAERKGVDEVCLRINGTVNRDTNFKILRYLIEKESEGTWHILMVSYDKKGVTKQAAFAFLKIGDRFGL